MNAKHADLSRRERQIMDIVYSLGTASAADVRGKLADAPSYTTVRTLLRILEKKGFVSHKSIGKKFVYRAKRQRQTVGRSALARLLNVYFDGSLQAAIATHLSSPGAETDTEELDAIMDLIEKARQEPKE